MRLHPISLGLRALRGERSIHGRQLPDRAEAVALLRKFTGRDFGADAAAWGAWLRANRWVYHARPDDPRLTRSGTDQAAEPAATADPRRQSGSGG